MLIRKLVDNQFKFFKNNIEIKNKTELEKINLLFKKYKVPPNYKFVELDPNSKIIAQCKDSKNRSQYIYNSKFIQKNFSNSEIKFVGKRNVLNKCSIKNTRLLNVLNNLKIQNNKKKELFIYQNNLINAQDVNNYLKRFGNFSTKYFRTWIANIEYINGMNNVYTDNFKKLSRDVIKDIAFKLNHTVAICKKNYIYPELIDYSLKNSISTSNPNKFLINFLKKRC